jgi:hypothetical protein
MLGQSQMAIDDLESGVKAAVLSGDLYLQGLNLANLAEAYRSQQQLERAILNGCLGMSLLKQINAYDWRQPAGLLTILQGQLGREAFQKLLDQHRTQIIAVIGVDGYDYIPELLEQY